MTVATEKRCPRCETTKPVEEFALRSSGRVRYSWCKECERAYNREYGKRWRSKPENKAKQREWNRQKRQRETPEQQRESKLRWKYGMTQADFEAMSEAQGHVCAICSRKPDLLHVDHDEATGQVRGLLCGTCNRGIGSLKHEPVILRAAADYLEASS